MPLSTNLPGGLDALLAQLKFVLPDLDLSSIDTTEMMRLNLHSLQEQFQEDLLYGNFFAMLTVETRHRLDLLENEQQDLENDLSEGFLAADPATRKLAATRIKSLVQQNAAWRALRDKISQTTYKLRAIETLVSDLHRKGIALNVLTARGRAELSAGLGH